MFAYKDFTKKMIDAGVNYFKFSIHGHIPEVHDYLTQVPGSLEQAVKGIKNIKSFNRTVEVNIVINKYNYRFLPQTVKFLIDLGISRFVLIYATFLGNALINKDEIAVRITDAAPYIKDSLDIVKDYNLDKAILTSVPICFMKGYEKYASSDLYPFRTEVKGPGFSVNLDDKLVDEKRKCEKCKECMYDRVCSGLRYDYVDIFGFDEVEPVPGKKISTPKEITTTE
jgi:cyclic pyranopterin phosphate synthase